MIASCVVHSRNRPSRVCGKRSNVRHSTSCRTPPTLMETRRFVCFVCDIKKGSGCIDDNDLLQRLMNKYKIRKCMFHENDPLNAISALGDSYLTVTLITWNVLFVIVLVAVHIVLLFRCRLHCRCQLLRNCYWLHCHSHHRL